MRFPFLFRRNFLHPLALGVTVKADVYMFLSIHNSDSGRNLGVASSGGGACVKDKSYRSAIVEHNGNDEDTAMVCILGKPIQMADII